MNLECLNDIITDNLAIHIDLTQLKSWDLNTGFTSISLTKWIGAVSDNINLMDFGLTEFDNGRTNIMWDGISLTPNDTLFTMYRVGYNEVENPTSGNTSGLTATTRYDLYPMSAVTTGTSGNYFELNGGYLQGFFKLKDYNYELLPARYNNGITIETLVYLYQDSHGIFYMMGTRAEDKYNPYFSGETITGLTTFNTIIKQIFTGVTTSSDDYLNSFEAIKKINKGFRDTTLIYRTEYMQPAASANTTNNVIAFELTQDRRLAYKYINADGLIITNTSPSIVTATGFTMIAIAFTPNNTIDDPALINCAPQRLGKLIFYVNGRAMWIIHDFPEFYFKPLNTQKEKQIGVPYSISWGGGSFGLEHSWHYDYQTYVMYNGEDNAYINSNFFVQGNPLPNKCHPIPDDNYLEGLSLSANSTTFKMVDECDPDIMHDLTVMEVKYTGETGTTTGKTYFIKFNHPISVLSNRDYNINLSIFDNGFTKTFDESGNTVQNTISLLVYSDYVDVNIINDTEYMNPAVYATQSQLEALGLHPFPDRQEYQYIYTNGVMYYGGTGLPVYDENGNLITYHEFGTPPLQSAPNAILTGVDSWKQLKSTFRTTDNSGQQFVHIGILLKTTENFNFDAPLFITDFTYIAADILVQDERKDNLTIQENFKPSFIGGIQKLRVYNNALTSQEILHNALIEKKKNPNIIVSKGGRIIYR